MNKTIRIALHTVYAIGLLLIFIFSGSKYDWMVDIDPRIVSENIENNTNNRLIFVSIILLTITSAQLIIISKSSRIIEGMLSALLIAIGITAFSLLK